MSLPAHAPPRTPGEPLTEEQLAWLRSSPEYHLEQMDAADAEEHLIDHIRFIWPVIEPGRPFTEGRSVNAVCDHLEAVSLGQITKLLINIPPGCMKSLTSNVCWPSWEWGPRNMPHLRYVGASYNVMLTIRDNRKCRNLILSDKYQRHWGDRFSLIDDQNTKIKFENDKTGFKFATSVGGVGTGERGDRVVIDDPHSVNEAESEAKREGALGWFTETMPTRKNDPEKSAIIVIMQRVHERDVSGHILAAELGYEHLCLPMEYESDHPFGGKNGSTSIGFTDWRIEEGELLWPERFTRNAVEDQKKDMSSWGGEYAVAGQFQQRPSPRGGGMLKRDWFLHLALPWEGGRSVRVWDLAGSPGRRSPYTVGTLLKKVRGKTIICNVVRGRYSPGEMDLKIKEIAERDGKGIPILLPQDPAQAGKHQRSSLASLLDGWDVHFRRESGDKVSRMVPCAAQLEAGNVYIVDSHWTEPFLAEAASFPTGRYKDQMDTWSAGSAWLLSSTDDEVPAGAEIIDGGAIPATPTQKW